MKKVLAILLAVMVAVTAMPITASAASVKSSKSVTIGTSRCQFNSQVRISERLTAKEQPYLLAATFYNPRIHLMWQDCVKKGGKFDGYIVLSKSGAETTFKEVARTKKNVRNFEDYRKKPNNRPYAYIVVGYKKNSDGTLTVSNTSLSVWGVTKGSKRENAYFPTINYSSKTMTKGQSLQLKLTFPANTYTKQIRWRSCNTKVATVSQNGLVKATGAGKTWIYGRTASGRDIKFTVTVKNPTTTNTSTSVKKPTSTYSSKVYMSGIDVSEHNGNIDLAKYKNGFVIIRGGYYNNIDKKAIRNMNLCDKYKIPYGVYWYSYALNTSQAKMEAEVCLKLIKGRRIRCGVWFDMEDADGYKARHGMPSNATISAMCNTFCSTMTKAGYYSGVYASQSWFGSRINTNYPKWVANWGPNNGTRTNNTSVLGPMHQYTSVPLDKNVMYVPLSTFASKVNVTATTPKKSITTIAKEVLDGKWGNGSTRTQLLKAAGYDADAVQDMVNKLLNYTK